MKKTPIFLFLLLTALFFNQKASAQASDVTTAVNLSINLAADVISIDLGADPNVVFNYITAADYIGAKTVSKTGHLSVISNQPYNISVAAQAAFTSSGDDTLPLNTVQVSVDPTTANGGTLLMAPLALATAPATGSPLVNNAIAGIGSLYNVTYTIPTAAPLLNLENQIFSTTIVYTATQL